MKGKGLLAGCVIGCFLLTGCQSKQTVQAETEATSFSQPEKKILTDSQQVEASSSTVASLITTNESKCEMEGSMTYEEIATSSSTTESQASIELPVTVEPVIQSVMAPVLTVKEQKLFSVVKNQTTEAFIQLIGTDAQQIAWNNGLYASVMIAQAILETGSGNSQLGQPPHHNLFGIKGSYQGKQVTFPTKEDKGNGQLYTIQSAFRQYPSYRESLEDYASLLKNGLSGNPRFYQGTWKENAATYQEATKALTGTYATDTSYDQKLNALIETYGLTNFDQEPKQEVGPTVSQEYHFEEASASQEVAESIAESNNTEEKQIWMTETKQPVVSVSPITQRPAKQVAGNQIVE